MPKLYTFPTLFDECKSISISDLNRWGYLKPVQMKSGIVTWSINGGKTSSIIIAVNTQSESLYLKLEYTCNENPIKYQVPLVSAPANIGKRIVWFFLRPNTGKRCKKLYLVGTYFFHCSAFKGCIYEKQTYSQNTRNRLMMYEKALGISKLYEELYNKNFKTYYAGKPTKRYVKLVQKINESESMAMNRKIDNI